MSYTIAIMVTREILSDNIKDIVNNSVDSFIKNFDKQSTGSSKQIVEGITEETYQDEVKKSQVMINDELNKFQRSFNIIKPKVTLPKPDQSILCKLCTNGNDVIW